MQNLDLYNENADSVATEQFVIKYRTLVKKISLYMKRRLPTSVELDDLLQSGLVGLLEARKTFKQDKGSSFETYASIRIKGAIIDSLRKSSWLHRDTVKNRRHVAEAISKIEQRMQRPAANEEIAAELGVTEEDYFKISQEITLCNMLSLDEIDGEYFLSTGGLENPQEINQRDSIKDSLKLVLNELSERDQQLLSLYYIEEFTFKQIGEIFDLTEARICQLHTKLIAEIRSKMKSEIEA